MFLSPAGQNKIPATRIVSLVPSQTELLYALDLTTEVIGITKFCIHPNEWYRNKWRVGGTKDINFEKILELQPDLVIANKEENVQSQIESISQHLPVWLTDVNNYAEALSMILDVGDLVNKGHEAADLVQKIEDAFAQNSTNSSPLTPACYLIWKEPYMTVGYDTFISDMMKHAGFTNVFASRTRYPTVIVREILESGCKVVLLSSEPYPFNEKHQEEMASLLPGIKIVLVDGEMFSWYGSRLLLAPAYFRDLQRLVLMQGD